MKNTNIVYSTQPDFFKCKNCRKNPCICAGQALQSNFILIITSEKKGRGGKTVTLMSGWQGKPDELERIAQKLRKNLGCGGTVRDMIAEFQGDHRLRLLAQLQKLGYKAKAGN